MKMLKVMELRKLRVKKGEPFPVNWEAFWEDGGSDLRIGGIAKKIVGVSPVGRGHFGIDK